MVSITGLNKAEVLYALYSRARIQGLGFISAREHVTLDTCRELVDPWHNVSSKDELLDRLVELTAMNIDNANDMLNKAQLIQNDDQFLDILVQCSEQFKHKLYFDYLYGRVLKVDLTDDHHFSEALYDRDNGPGAAESALLSLRNSKKK